MVMTTWWIWLLPGVLLCDVVIQSLIRRHRARYQQPMLTDVQMDEIHASIEVYDFANGREVNRHHVYPIACMRRASRSFTGLAMAMRQVEDASRKAGQVFSDKLGRGPW